MRIQVFYTRIVDADIIGIIINPLPILPTLVISLMVVIAVPTPSRTRIEKNWIEATLPTDFFSLPCTLRHNSYTDNSSKILNKSVVV